MSRAPLDVPGLLATVDDPRSAEDLRTYFHPAPDPTDGPPFPGSYFEDFAGGGDHPTVANTITAQDLVAVNLLNVDVPGRVALQLLEGELGEQVGALLAAVPTDVALHEPGGAELTAPHSAARQAWDLLELQPGMGWVTANTILARKRPHLMPVYNSIFRCALGSPLAPWAWLRTTLTAENSALVKHLRAVQASAGVPTTVSVLRVLDILLWMRHHHEHQRIRCPGMLAPLDHEGDNALACGDGGPARTTP